MGAPPVEDASIPRADLMISAEKLMTGSGISDSICVEPGKRGGEAEEFVRVLLTTRSSSAEAKDDVPGTNPGGILLTGEDEAWDVLLTALLEDGERVEREAAVSSISIGSEIEKVKLAEDGGKSGIEPGGRARPEVSIGDVVSIVGGVPWMDARVSRSAANIWGRRGADPSCTIAVEKGLI